MLTFFLIFVIIVMACVIVYIHRTPVRVSNAALQKIGELTLLNQSLNTNVEKLNLEIKAMDEGQQEIIDNYENDFLTYKERIAYLEKCKESLEEENATLEGEALHHRQNCLPSLAGMTEMAREGVLGTYKVE